ncbi:MAG: hypothetical protein ACI85U_004391, partial [Candidatus Promineifilaceae bacterium]
TLGPVNIRLQPSTESDIVAKLVYLEALQVLARAADSSWWQVLLHDTSTGWVFDSTGSMVGLMESVPVINPDGSLASEAAWQPTPDLFCPTAEPSPTPTVTPVPSETPTEVPTDVPSATPPPEPTQEVAAIAVASSEPDSGVISPLPDDPKTSSENSSKQPASESSQVIDSASSNNSSANSASTSQPPAGGSFNWVILTGIALVLFGFVALIFQSRRKVAVS